MKNSGLGKGLGALLPSQASSIEQGIDILLIDPCKTQPRKLFDDEKLTELADSIKTHGVIQPLVLRKTGDRYTIIAGERRFRAAKKAGLTIVPAVIKDIDDASMLEMSIIENIQREDLNPIEEAQAIDMLMKEHNLTQQMVCERIGKSRSAVANTLRLMSLPQNVQGMLISGALTPGHARAVLSLPDEKLMREAAQTMVQRGMSVREAEKYAKSLMKKLSAPKYNTVSPEFKKAEQDLTQSLGTRVKIVGDDNSGKFVINYYNKEQLNMLYDFFMSAKGQ